MKRGGNGNGIKYLISTKQQKRAAETISTMKWTSANSSDRKSVFYTSEDSNNIISSTKEQQLRQQQQQQQHKLKGTSLTDNSNSLFTFKMGGDDETTTTTENQNSKTSSANGSIKRHTSNGTDLKRYLKNFMLFSNLEIESEKKCRDEQLSKIVKALMMFEKKLRKEQEIIQQQLCEKDKVINRQMHTISNMKVKLGVEDDGDNDADEIVTLENNETAEFCPMCRKKYYLRATKSVALQTTKSGFPNNISDDYSSIQSIEYMSSSEEQEVLHSPNPFSTARRSKKYTSKKSYKEYLQSRPQSLDAGNRNKTTINANASDKNNNTISAATRGTEQQQQHNGKEIGISKCGGAAKFSLIMNDIHGIKQQQRQQSTDDTHSLKINRMHGISLTTLNGISGEESEKEMASHNNGNNDNSGNVSCCADADSHDDAIKVTVTDDKKECNDNSCNNSSLTDGVSTTTGTKTRKYCDEGLEVKQKIVTRDDWYISDIDENETIGVTKSPYGNISTGVSNSVLECVNQILLQQSMDEYIESQKENKPKEIIKDTTTTPAPTRSNKRVHFSTKNSMVQIKALPRHHHSLPLDLNSDDDVLNSTYENQSTYSNEYELIGSSRTYVDMDTKSTIDNFKPTLPPKPSNLMKLQQIAKQRAFVQDQIYNKKSNSDYDESEPDYASISEIQDTIKSVKVVTAEIHNDGDNLIDNEYSEIKEVPTTPPPPPSESLSLNDEDDSFADVPKLPNVYSIIPGIETPATTPNKKDASPNTNKCIGHDNYITKSPMKKKIPIANFASVKSKVLTEVNNATNKKQVAPPVPLKHQQTIKIIDEEIQQEFDWYNLDAEYTKTDIVITPQIENIKEMYQFDDENIVNSDDAVVKVEYNLEDFEYETVPSSECSVNGIEIETNNNNFTTVIKINESSSSSASSTSSTCEIHQTTPAKKSTTTNLMELAETPRVDFKKSNKIRYEKFLKESGLISKPILMSKKKFYAEGSFV